MDLSALRIVTIGVTHSLKLILVMIPQLPHSLCLSTYKVQYRVVCKLALSLRNRLLMKFLSSPIQLSILLETIFQIFKHSFICLLNDYKLIMDSLNFWQMLSISSILIHIKDQLYPKLYIDLYSPSYYYIKISLPIRVFCMILSPVSIFSEKLDFIIDFSGNQFPNCVPLQVYLFRI